MALCAGRADVREPGLRRRRSATTEWSFTPCFCSKEWRFCSSRPETRQLSREFQTPAGEGAGSWRRPCRFSADLAGCRDGARPGGRRANCAHGPGFHRRWSAHVADVNAAGSFFAMAMFIAFGLAMAIVAFCLDGLAGGLRFARCDSVDPVANRSGGRHPRNRVSCRDIGDGTDHPCAKKRLSHAGHVVPCARGVVVAATPRATSVPQRRMP